MFVYIVFTITFSQRIFIKSCNIALDRGFRRMKCSYMELHNFCFVVIVRLKKYVKSWTERWKDLLELWN